MSKDLVFSDELKNKIDALSAAAFKKLGLKKGVVEVWEDGYRTEGEAGAFEWWYFDCQLEDGSAWVVTFNTKPHTKPESPLEPSVLLMHRSSEGESRRDSVNFRADEFSSSKDSCDVKIGPNWVRGDLKSYEMHVEVNNMACDFKMERESPSWRPGTGTNFLDKNMAKYFAWVVPVPYGTIEGKLTIDGKTSDVRGRFYHDHNWGNVVLARMLDHWFWGRGHMGDYSFIFTQMVTNGILGHGAVRLPVFLLARGEEVLIEDNMPFRLETFDFVDATAGRKYPSRLELSWRGDGGEVLINISDPRMIEALDMRLKGDEAPLLKKIWMRIVANSYYFDFDAEAELKINYKGINETLRGRLIFEQMQFHKKLRR